MKWFIKVLRHYADFSGRARRKEYWMFVLFNLLFAWAWALLLILLAGSTGKKLEHVLPTIYLSYYMVMLLPGLAVSVRRLHDTGKSGWMLLINLIPLIGGIWLLILMLTPGQESENRYGPDPKTSDEDFSEREKLRSLGRTLLFITSTILIYHIGNALYMHFQHFVSLIHPGLLINLFFYTMLLITGIIFLGGTKIWETKGKTRNAMLLLLTISGLFFLVQLYNVFSGLPLNWLYLLSLLSIVVFSLCYLFQTKNESLNRIAAIGVIVLSALDYLDFLYTQISDPFSDTFPFRIVSGFISIAYIVLAATFYPVKTGEQRQ